MSRSTLSGKYNWIQNRDGCGLPTVGHVIWIATIVTELDKITRLDEGNPTDIIEKIFSEKI